MQAGISSVSAFSASVLESLRESAAGVALVRADGEGFEAVGLVDREEATWVTRALGGSSGTFELTAGKRVRLVDAFEVAAGTALVVVRDGARPIDEARIARALGALRKGRSPARSAPEGLGSLQARRR